jgi:hypothetical protein
MGLFSHVAGHGLRRRTDTVIPVNEIHQLKSGKTFLAETLRDINQTLPF